MTALTGFHCNIVFQRNSSITESVPDRYCCLHGIHRNRGCDIKPGNEKEKKQNISVALKKIVRCRISTRDLLAGVPNENIVQNHLNIALLNVF